MFQQLYQSYCQSALRETCGTQDGNFSTWYCQRIQDHVVDNFSSLQHDSAYELHRKNLALYADWWAEIKSNQDCLVCLRRKPEHTLTCRHSTCEPCVRTFGLGVPTSEVAFEIKSCVLCSTGRLSIHLKPKTAGVSILSIDGGGTRGIVPLQFLKMVQQCLGQTCAVQDLFDFVIGTSSGGISSPPNNFELLTIRRGPYCHRGVPSGMDRSTIHRTV